MKIYTAPQHHREVLEMLKRDHLLTGVFGDALFYNLAPPMFNNAVQEQELAVRFLAFKVSSRELGPALDVVRDADVWKGVMLLRPHGVSGLPFIDHLLLDLKWMARPVFNPEISLPPDVFEQNLFAIQDSSSSLTYRLVLIREFLNGPGKQEALLNQLQKLPSAPIELLPLHNLAEAKYRQLGIPFTPLSAPPLSAQKDLQDFFQSKLGVPVRLLSL